MITEGNLIAVSTLAALYVSCYICLLIDQNSCESKDLDLTLSSAINSTPPECFFISSIVVIYICCKHCYDRCFNSKLKTILIFIGLLCIFTLKATKYNKDPITGMLCGIDGIIHYSLAVVGVFILFIFITIVADSSWKLLATKVNFGCLLIVALAQSSGINVLVSKRLRNLGIHMIALFENLCLLTFGLILYLL